MYRCCFKWGDANPEQTLWRHNKKPPKWFYCSQEYQALHHSQILYVSRARSTIFSPHFDWKFICLFSLYFLSSSLFFLAFFFFFFCFKRFPFLFWRQRSFPKIILTAIVSKKKKKAEPDAPVQICTAEMREEILLFFSSLFSSRRPSCSLFFQSADIYRKNLHR